MKKNLLSIIILSLLIVNIALTAVMMLNVMGTNQKTAAIVTDIASILNLELDKGDGSSSGTVSLADTVVYSVADSMTISLRRDEGETQDHYCIVKVSFSMDSTSEDYATYGGGTGDLSSMETLMKSEVINVISGYTLSEAKLGQQQMCDEILKRIQDLFGSDFIYKVSFSEIMFG